VNARTAVLGVALVVVAVVLLIVLSGGDDSGSDTTTSGSATGKASSRNGGGETSGKPEVTTIVVGKNGKPVGGVAEIDVHKGDEVRFEVKSAIAEEIHLHGYDLMKDVPAGGTVSFVFPAELEGIFEAELEGEAEQILELRVEP
jgi:FtsP/CotA-like multicopper oxidase with cupredoxin domain